MVVMSSRPPRPFFPQIFVWELNALENQLDIFVMPVVCRAEGRACKAIILYITAHIMLFTHQSCSSFVPKHYSCKRHAHVTKYSKFTITFTTN